MRQKAQLADVNGDGLPDFVVAFKENDNQVLDTYLNTGRGWVRKQAWSMPYMFWTYTGGKGRQTGQLVDVNGDGYPDFVRAFDSSQDLKRLDTWLSSRQGIESETIPSMPRRLQPGATAPKFPRPAQRSPTSTATGSPTWSRRSAPATSPRGRAT